MKWCAIWKSFTSQARGFLQLEVLELLQLFILLENQWNILFWNTVVRMLPYDWDLTVTSRTYFCWSRSISDCIFWRTYSCPSSVRSMVEVHALDMIYKASSKMPPKIVFSRILSTFSIYIITMMPRAIFLYRMSFISCNSPYWLVCSFILPFPCQMLFAMVIFE